MAGASALAKLVADPAAPAEHAALLVAKDAYPALDVAHYLGVLDQWACDFEGSWSRRLVTGGVMDPFAAARALGAFLFNGLGFEGNKDAYYDARNSYLNDVIDSRRGIPLTLAIVILALARRAGLVADGIAFPGHFLVRLGGASGCFIDPFLGARILSSVDLEILLKRALGPSAEVSREHLAVADTRGMVIRMLNNLRAIFERSGDFARGLVVCDRLVDLDAGPFALRDRGLCALALGAREAARADLSAYLHRAPKAEDRARIERAMARAKSPSTLN
jgi:regulator of sirC expression with transglutaminase-like and TPR domain